MKRGHKKALVLNADYVAISLVPWQTAIKQDWKGLVNVIDFYKDDFVRCGGQYKKYPIPAVIVQKDYKQIRGDVPYARRNVFIRDELQCQYCGDQFHYKQLTLDHVMPRSRYPGKHPTHFQNVVTCCHSCNGKKRDMTLAESGMKLIQEPIQPVQRKPHIWVKGLAPWTLLQPEWLDYIPKRYKKLLLVDHS